MNAPKLAAKMLTLEVAVIALFVVPAAIYAAATISKTPTTNSPNSLQSGLVGHWTFDAPTMVTNVADSSGQGKTGQLWGYTATTTKEGRVGQALEFNGSTEAVDLPNLSTLIPGNNITMAAWVKSDLSTGIHRAFFTEDYAGDNNVKFRLAIGDDTEDGLFNAGFFNGSWRLAFDSTPIKTNTWYHVVGTYDGTTVRLYRDGVEVATHNYSGSLPTASEGWRIGTRHDEVNGNHHWDGLIDDVRLYNRTLSADEVKRLYGLGATTHIAVSPKSGLASPTQVDGSSSGLVGHWTFDGADFLQNVVDRSGTGNTGYLINYTSTTTVEGRVGQALAFNGSTQNVHVPDHASLDPTSAITVGAWVYPTTNGITGRRIVQKDTVDTQYGLVQDGTTLTAWVGTPAQDLLQVSNIFTATNKWYFVVMVYDGSNLYLYNNGAQVGSTPASGSINTSSNILNIGFKPNSVTANDHFAGSIDDVRIYNRALSASEVKQLYGIGATAHVGVTPVTGLAKDSGLIGHWTFDGSNLLQNVKDSSSQARNGLLDESPNNPPATTTTEGKVGQALWFDGVDDGVTFTTKALNNLSTGSIAFYIKMDVIEARFPIYEDGSGLNNFAAITPSASPGVLTFNIGGNTSRDSTSRVWQAGRWYHIAFTWGSEMNIYVDGVLDNTIAVSGGTLDRGGHGTQFGRVVFGAGPTINNHFNGALDDVRIYNRALSAEEVKRLYQLGI